jgi:hypothetical protein
MLVFATVLTACEATGELIPGDETNSPDAATAEPPPILVTPVVTIGTETETATPTPTIPDHELARSVLQVRVIDSSTFIRTIRDGTGVVINGDEGLILTAFSLVNPYTASGARAYSTIAIGVNTGNGGDPTLAYEAVLVAANSTTDLAVLRLTREYQGAPLTSGQLSLASAKLGDAPIIEPGDKLRLFAHLGLAIESVDSQAVTVTNGTVTGRRGEAALPHTSRLKLDARLPYGATGGPAFDIGGSLVGILVPEHYNVSSPVSQLRPIQLADELIETAHQFPRGEAFLPPLIAAPPPAGFGAALIQDGSWVSRPAFAENATNVGNQLDLFDYQRGFLSETQTLYFEYATQGLAPDALVEERWFLNDVLQDSLSSSYPWPGNGFIIVADQISVPTASGLPDGFWRLEIWVDGTRRATSTAVIGVDPTPPEITNATFGALASENGRKLTNAVAGAEQLLMFFDYSAMELSRSIRWVVFYNGSLRYQSNEVTWLAGDADRLWIGYTDANPIEAGTWRFEFFVDSQLRATNEVIIP